MAENESSFKNGEYISDTDVAFIQEEKDKYHKTNNKQKTLWVTRSIAEEIGREEVLKRTLIEFLIYVIFTILATIYIIGVNSTSMYYLTKCLREQFVEHEFNTLNDVSITFENIKTAADFWFYVENHMVDSFFWESTFGAGEAPDPDAMNILYENRVLGVPRMRQVKVRNNSCEVHEYFRKFFLNCYDEYSANTEDKEAFGLKTKTAWVYSSSNKTKSLSFWGKITTYGGGGFYVDLTDNKNKTLKIIQKLKEKIWLGRGTRAIFVDFSVYNANVNLFGVVKLVFEFPSTGGVIPSANIRSVNLIRFHNKWEWVILICEVCCYVFIFYYILEEMREIIYFGRHYFCRFWNYVDLSVIALTITGLILSVFIILEVPSSIEKIKKNPKKYANLEYVTELQYKRNNVLAIALYLIYIKAFKFLNINRTMGQLNNTLNRCARDILGFSMMFFIVFFAYAELGYLLFGHQVENFSTFSVSMFTLLRTILGDFDYQEIAQANRILAPIYFVSYIFLVFFVLLNMFLAIINDTYSDVKTEIALAPDEMQMTEYIRRKFRKLMRKLGCGRFFPEGKEEENETQATLREIREVLKKCGFSDVEIEMFFVRYNIDPWANIKIRDSEKLIEELNDILRDDKGDGVRLEDFQSQQEKLQQIEHVIGQLVDKVKTLLEKLDSMENVIKETV